MSSANVIKQIAQLENWFHQHSPCTIATSGGIDSMLLAFIANKTLGKKALIVHSSSFAVPNADAKRIRLYADKYQWNYQIVNSGEIENTHYQNNPVDRCYYCKSCLFTKLANLNYGVIITGTNQDDLTDYRPGLIAAKQNNVQQPYVDLAINKAMIRQIADYFALDDLKDLPASPCLASRIETGIKINTHALQLVDHIESMVKKTLHIDMVRFRIKKSALEVQLAAEYLQTINETTKNDLISAIQQQLPAEFVVLPLNITSYHKGSAFVGDKSVNHA